MKSKQFDFNEQYVRESHLISQRNYIYQYRVSNSLPVFRSSFHMDGQDRDPDMDAGYNMIPASIPVSEHVHPTTPMSQTKIAR
jgi:hypothetical protein